jgi:hypothetical protein
VWLKDAVDVEQTASGINAYLPCDCDDDGRLIKPVTGTQARQAYDLFSRYILVIRVGADVWMIKGNVNCIFLSVVIVVRMPHMRETCCRYQYISPRRCDEYVVSTHWLLALLIDAHTNMVLCVQEAWSIYLLKNTMKALSSGSLESVKDTSLDAIL